MTDVTFLNDVTVELIDRMGTDLSVVRAARVSLAELTEVRELAGNDVGLINYLVREHHGSPFEHNAFTFYVKAPIFVFREFMRHRIGFSYNEMSGRYTKLLPEFYAPDVSRPLVNLGTSARPEFGDDPIILWPDVIDTMQNVCGTAWDYYERLLDSGVANEVARMVLPVNIMSQMYVTCNARSLMSFLSLRTQDERATHVSRPQREIAMVAEKMEAVFATHFPVTYDAFNSHGRVAP